MPGSVKVGYEISFTRCYYKVKRLRPLTETHAEILTLEIETDGILEYTAPTKPGTLR